MYKLKRLYMIWFILIEYFQRQICSRTKICAYLKICKRNENLCSRTTYENKTFCAEFLKYYPCGNLMPNPVYT